MKLLDAIPHLVAVDPQQQSRVRLVPSASLQGLHDELPLLMLVQQKRFRAFKNTLENFFPTVWGIYHPERIRFTQ